MCYASPFTSSFTPVLFKCWCVGDSWPDQIPCAAVVQVIRVCLSECSWGLFDWIWCIFPFVVGIIAHGCTRGIKILRPVFAGDHVRKKRRDQEKRAGLFCCVWIPANCLDEETLMSLVSHISPQFFSWSFPTLFLAHFLSVTASPFSFTLFFFFCAICSPQLPNLPFPPTGLGSVASNAFHSDKVSTCTLFTLSHIHTHARASPQT